VQLQLLEEPVLRPDGRQRHHVESGASHRAELQKMLQKVSLGSFVTRSPLCTKYDVRYVQSFVLRICQSLSIRLLPEPESPSKREDSKVCTGVCEASGCVATRFSTETLYSSIRLIVTWTRERRLQDVNLWSRNQLGKGRRITTSFRNSNRVLINITEFTTGTRYRVRLAELQSVFE
jgi:hypothetical protein